MSVPVKANSKEVKSISEINKAASQAGVTGGGGGSAATAPTIAAPRVGGMAAPQIQTAGGQNPSSQIAQTIAASQSRPVRAYVVSGVYFISKENEGSLMRPFPVLFDDVDEFQVRYHHPLPDNQVIKCDSAGFGFVLMHKSIVPKMREAFPGQSMFMERGDADDSKFVGEDIIFFRRMKKAGIPLHAHTGALVKHMKRFSVDYDYYALYWANEHLKTTKRESILAGIRTALTNTTGVSTRIYRSRVEPLARGELPAIVVEPINDVCVQLTSTPTLDWTLTVRIAVIVRGNIPDQVADPIVESLHAKVMADLTVGGHAYDVQPTGVSFDMQEAYPVCYPRCSSSRCNSCLRAVNTVLALALCHS